MSLSDAIETLILQATGTEMETEKIEAASETCIETFPRRCQASFG